MPRPGAFDDHGKHHVHAVQQGFVHDFSSSLQHHAVMRPDKAPEQHGRNAHATNTTFISICLLLTPTMRAFFSGRGPSGAAMVSLAARDGAKSFSPSSSGRDPTVSSSSCRQEQGPEGDAQHYSSAGPNSKNHGTCKLWHVHATTVQGSAATPITSTGDATGQSH